MDEDMCVDDAPLSTRESRTLRDYVGAGAAMRGVGRPTPPDVPDGDIAVAPADVRARVFDFVAGGAAAKVPRIRGPRGLAAALEGMQQKMTVQSVTAKIATGEMQHPVVPLLEFDDFEAALELPDAERGQKPCLQGPTCTAYDLPGAQRVPGAGPLVAMKLGDWPDEAGRRLLEWGAAEGMPCLSCLMHSQTTHISENMRTRAEQTQIVQLFKVCMGPGGFDAADCHPPCAWDHFTGAPYPTPKWDPTKFEWAERVLPDGTRRAYVKHYFTRCPPQQQQQQQQQRSHPAAGGEQRRRLAGAGTC